MEAIEEPWFEVTTMKVDRPGARSIQIRYKNEKILYFRAYSIAMEKRLYDPREKFLSRDSLITLLTSGA